MDKAIPRLKVLMSAYACEPNRGSEPGVGWNWAMAMSEHADITVITRANNKEVIEEWVKDQPVDSLDNLPEFIYYDPPQMFLAAKKTKLMPVQAFYLAWQLGVSLLISKRIRSFNLIHHVTFNSMMSPGFWWWGETPVLLGPLGGTSCVSKNYKSIYGRLIWKENIRGFLIRNWSKLPWLRFSFNRASGILCANSETESYLRSRYPDKVSRLLETGVKTSDVDEAPSINAESNTTVRVVWVGAIEPWKALHIALQAYAKAHGSLKNSYDLQLDVIGQGSGLEKSRAETIALEINDSVTFHGRLPLEETKKKMRNSDILLFSSIKDTSGNVVLEAMSMSKPVVCLKHQGSGDMTTDETAIRVLPGTIEETVDRIAVGLVKLAKSPEYRAELGLHGRQRIIDEYTWANKAKKMMVLYKQAINGEKLCQSK